MSYVCVPGDRRLTHRRHGVAYGRDRAPEGLRSRCGGGHIPERSCEGAESAALDQYLCRSDDYVVGVLFVLIFAANLLERERATRTAWRVQRAAAERTRAAANARGGFN